MAGEVLVLWVVCFGYIALSYVPKGLVAYATLVCATTVESYSETYMSIGTDPRCHSWIRARLAPQ
jgi:hypothetical protein